MNRTGCSPIVPASTLRAEHGVRQCHGHRHAAGRTVETPVGQPQPVGLGRIARRVAHLCDQRLFAHRPGTHLGHVGGQRDRHRLEPRDPAASIVPHANLVQGVAVHPSGEFALITLMRTKNLVPMTRVHQGWTITNGLGVIWQDGRVDQALLDQPGLCFPDPAAVAITPDGRRALVTSSSTDRVAIIDVSKLVQLLQQATPHDRQQVIPNHLGKSAEFVLAYVPTKNSPRSVLAAPDNQTAFVANALDDSLSVIDIAGMRGGTNRLGRAPRDHPGPLRRAAVQQRRHHFSQAVLVPLLPSRRPHRHDHLRYRAGWHRSQRGGQPHAAGYFGHGAVQMERDQSQLLAAMRRTALHLLHARGTVYARRSWLPSIAMCARFPARPTASAPWARR